MRFVILYSGALPSGQGRKPRRAAAKRSIREQVDPQLFRLWQQGEPFRRLRWNARVPSGAHGFMGTVDSPLYEYHKHEPGELQEGMVNLCSAITIKGTSYIPIVRRELGLTCSLDILFLRQGEPGSIRREDGDLDNRIKIFLDALSVPHEDELPFGSAGSDIVRLYDDDSRIRNLTIRSDRLLLPPGENPDHVHLVVEVKIHVESVGTWNISLL